MVHHDLYQDNVVIVPRWLTALLKGRFDEHCEEQGHNRKHKNIFTYGTGRNQSYAVVKLDNTNEVLDCSNIQVNHIMSAPSNYRNARWLLNGVNLP
ncbi:hypothetical protein WN943_018837 [Citrus x changshan-huyou]